MVKLAYALGLPCGLWLFLLLGAEALTEVRSNVASKLNLDALDLKAE